MADRKSDGNSSTSEEPAMVFNPLSTSNARRQVLAVQDAFSCFWDQEKFKTGLAAPPVPKSDVSHLIKRAAEYVVYIQQHLELEGSKLPVMQGCAKELLWELNYNPLKEPERFVRELVHAAFKNQGGYIEDLTESVIDEYIEEIEDYQSNLPTHNDRHPKNRNEYTATNCDWTLACQLAQQLVEHLIQVQNLPPSIEHHPRWLNICRDLEHTDRMLEEILSLDPNIEIKNSNKTPRSKFPNTLHDARNARRRKRKLFRHTLEEKSAKRPNVESNETPKDQQFTQPEKEEKKEPEDSTVTVQIGKVKEDVEKRKQDLCNLVEESTLIKNNNNQITEEAIQKLQQRCLESSESLMRDLLALDQLVVSNTEQRQQRKAQVNAIQDMLDTTDRMSQQLSSLLRELRSQRKAQQEQQQQKQQQQQQQQKQEQEQQQQQQQQEQQEQQQQQQEEQQQQQQLGKDDLRDHKQQSHKTQTQPQKETTRENPPQVRAPGSEAAQPLVVQNNYTPAHPSFNFEDTYINLRSRLANLAQHALQEEIWRTVKMDPNFEVKELSDRYVIQGSLPGVSIKDLSVDLSEDETVLVISGHRIPDQNEVKVMLGQLVSAIQQGKVNLVRLSQLTDEQLLLLCGSGRFGSFVRRYKLPEEIDKHQINAKLDRGVLAVNLPKLPPPQHPNRYHRLHDNDSPFFSPLLSSLWPSTSLDDLFW